MDLEVVPIVICDVTSHRVCVTHGVCSCFVSEDESLLVRRHLVIRGVDALSITLDLQEPGAGWEHLRNKWTNKNKWM